MCKNNGTRRRASKKGVTRRDVIRYGVASSLGIAALGPLGKGILQEASGAPLPNHKRCVVIYCYGGYDGLNMVVPHGVQAYYDRRPNIAIDSIDTLDIGHTGYGLNPGLQAMKDVHDDPVRGNQLAVFQKVGYPDDDLSHFNSQDFYSWGVRNGFGNLTIPESGWIGRFADAYTTDSLGAVSVGVGRPLDMEGSSVNPLMVDRLTSFEFDEDNEYEANHQLRIDAVQSILAGYSGSGGLDDGAQQALQQAHDLTNQIQMAVDNYTPPAAGQPQYPGSEPGRDLEDIMRMIQAGFDTKIFYTGFGGWDNHSNLINAMGFRIGRLNDALAAFIAHCQALNIWDDMLICIESEFGRRIFENGSFGDDHGHGNVFFAMGGGVNGGYYGPDLTTNEMENNNWLGYDIDFRDIRKEMINDWFGGDGDQILPEPQEINQNLGYLL
ncbi:MAG: DUF1501 domain-containing protein [Planctomycetota bacterium]|nr:DUF1501 domain-containing protein [Planctomycetota bacterium]